MKRKLLLLSIVAISAFSKGVFEYDAQKGWWWYKETIVDKNGKKHQIKERFTTKEKMEFENKQKIVELLKEQKKYLKKIKERLEYAYPNITPKYGINKKTGEKCIANSSADCFVMPIQPEAQHVPVIANFLKNPTKENASEYLKWQATYFNHLTDVSYGLRFSYLSGGPDVYPTNTSFTYGDNLGLPTSEKTLTVRKLRIIDQLADKIGIMIFLGKNTFLENSVMAYSSVYGFTKDLPWKNVKFSVVVDSEESKKKILKRAKDLYYIDPGVKKFWEEKVTWIVNPKMFEKFHVMVTPTTLAFYKTDKGDLLWDIISTGTLNASDTRDKLIRFLVYNKIIEPKEMAGAYNQDSVQKGLPFKKVKVHESENEFRSSVIRKQGDEK